MMANQVEIKKIKRDEVQWMNNLNSNKRFIIVTSPDVASKLRNLNYTEIPSSDGGFLFLNDGKQLFDNEANGCVYTNLVCF